jgi:branched-chain amino acid aminotransferase
VSQRYDPTVERRVYVDGRITAPEEAVIPVLDHGFLFGDSVYEVLWWHHGALIQEKDHLDRLEASAGRLYMDVQVPREDLVAAMEQTVRAAGAGPRDDAYVRLIVTRGTGPLGLDFSRVSRRSVVIMVAPADRPGEAVVRRGLRVALVHRLRLNARALDPGAKTGNYLNNVLALHEARMAGADDAIMLNQAGEVTEATTANVYAVTAGALVTPPLEAGILKGTTRTRILGLCGEAGIDAREATLLPAALRGADEVFLSSSVRGILPVVAIDGAPVGDGRPGAVTMRIRELFEAAADAEARERVGDAVADPGAAQRGEGRP